MEVPYSDDSDQYCMSMYDSESYSDDYWHDYDDYDDDDDDDDNEEEEEELQPQQQQQQQEKEEEEDDDDDDYDEEEEEEEQQQQQKQQLQQLQQLQQQQQQDDDDDDEERCYDGDEDDEYFNGGEEICSYDSEEDDQDDYPPVTFLLFDLETTGLDGIDNRIIEIAIMDLDSHGQSSFYSLVNPGCPVTNSYIHGITNNMVNTPLVPRMQGLIPNMIQFVRSRQKPRGYVVWVAHNARCFDVPFLANEFKRCATQIPSNWLFLDTLPLVYAAMKNTGSQVGGRLSLQALREHYGIGLTGSPHNAMSDVHALAEVLNRIMFDLNLSIGDLLQMTFTVKNVSRCLLS